MLKRLHIYFREMYPIIPRLLLGGIIFFEIYFIILLNNGGFTVFSFLCWLRIADDFKDYELDCRLFAERPLPSGRVRKKDLGIFISLLLALTVLLNIRFMNNIPFFVFLYVYGTLMSMWFFQKKTIQKSLPLALVTHNPVQMILNIYIISFTCIKYGLNAITLTTVLAAFTLYFPALIWEISRKIKAPEDETEYVTYSKLFGYRKATRFVLILTIADIITNFLLVYRLSRLSVLALLINVIWMTWKFVSYMRDPHQFRLVDKVERYTYIQESIMLLTVGGYIVFAR